jgi:hypothetical protein
MTSIVTASRIAIEDALRADVGMIAAFNPSKVRLYPLTPPANPTFPYGLYRIDIVGDDIECAEGAEVTVTVDWYAREADYASSAAKVEALGDAGRKALRKPLTLVGHTCDDWRFEFDRSIGDPDILTAHRSMQVTYLTTADT